MKASQLKKIMEHLPSAFDYKYWNMANTTYREEVFLAIIAGLKIPKEDALKLQSKIFPKNKIIRSILKEEFVECMGSYGAGFIGVSFFGSYVNKYNGKGLGTTKIILTKQK